jgi:hypothetical protein
VALQATLKDVGGGVCAKRATVEEEFVIVAGGSSDG